ncbi:MAG: NADH-quinone oxidoreductase subunit A [Phycisphaerales bacterium]|nr:NADH-quinone oxidoreductase subunit A [Phycisphaerales bacterium]
MLLGTTDWAVVGLLVLFVIFLAGAILVLTHVIGPKRTGPVKELTYESGVDPIGDARKRFNVHFYIIAMLFLLFDVEIVFFYPWASLFGRLTQPVGAMQTQWSEQMVAGGYGPTFFLVEMLIFIAVLGVGYVYAWRKGVFRWA